MILLLHILNCLLAFPCFLFYNYAGIKLIVFPAYVSGSIMLLPVVLVLAGNLICSFLFTGENSALRAAEWTAGFGLVYVTLHYLKLRKANQSHKHYIENLLMAKDHAEIEALKLQLDPHFLFNSLNTLHHLIKPENEEARKYVHLLADAYRYILKNKTKELVLLREELNFSQQYFYLLSIRFGKAIRFNTRIDSLKAEDYLVIPISIQTLIENAIKHNRFTVEEPLELFINMDEESILVENKVRENNRKDSLKIGLANLSERSKMITNRPLVINSSDFSFSVRLPLIKYK